MSPRGENNPNWRGGRIRGGHRKQYWLRHCPDHPFATAQGYVMEHRLVVELSIGRYLSRDEVVHHINGVHDDNRIENLQVMTQGEHARLHNSLEGKRHVRRQIVVEHVCEVCKEPFTTYTKATQEQRFCTRACYWDYRRYVKGQLHKGVSA